MENANKSVILSASFCNIQICTIIANKSVHVRARTRGYKRQAPHVTHTTEFIKHILETLARVTKREFTKIQ